MIHHKLFFSQPPEEVWEYLTKAELMSQWLMPNNFMPIVGYDFEFRTKPSAQLAFDGIAYCKVIEIVPFKKLSYSWKLGPGHSKITLDSIVFWELKATENGTELSLIHTGFKEIENLTIYSAMNEGWLKNMNKIKQFINILNDDKSNI